MFSSPLGAEVDGDGIDLLLRTSGIDLPSDSLMRSPPRQRYTSVHLTRVERTAKGSSGILVSLAGASAWGGPCPNGSGRGIQRYPGFPLMPLVIGPRHARHPFESYRESAEGNNETLR